MVNPRTLPAVAATLVSALALVTLFAQNPPALNAVDGPQAPPAAPGKTQTPTKAPTSRRSQRIKMQAIEVASPNGKVKFSMPANAERLTYAVSLERTPVIE